MSLLSQKKENDRVAAEAAAKAKEEAVLRDLAVHPVIKMGCSREVRDAYLYGIVVAAIANDDKIDAEERGILDRIANSMEIPDADVEETIGHVNQMSVDEKLQLLEESVGAFKDQADLVKFFYAQFAELWLTGEHNLGELNEIMGMLVEWSGVEFPVGRLKDIKTVVSNAPTLNLALDDLSVWLGEDLLLRFAVSRYGNVSLRIAESRIEKAKAARQKAELKAQQEELERVNRVRAEFDSQIETVGEKYKVNGSMPAGWYDDVWGRFREISPLDIDWVVEVNSRLKALRQIPHCYAKLVVGGQERSRRKLVWKVVCMILVLRHGTWNGSGSVNDLLRSAMSLSTDGYNKKLEGFIVRNFSDVVTFS